jgi:iron complex outermembrane recepter protein
VYVDDPQNTNNQRYMAAQDAVIAPAGTKVNGVDVSGTPVCWVTTQAAYAPLFPGCVPMNLFNPNGPSQESFNYIKGNTAWALTQKLDDVNASIAGGLFGLGLPAGEITAALSAEMRWRTYDMKSNALPTDFVNCTGLRMCTVNGGAAPALWTQNVNAPISVGDNVWETAIEFNVPLLKDVPLAQDLNADISARYTTYSISGVAQTWKLGFNDKINDTFRLRGTMSFDIRAPNLNDLYQPLGISSTGFTDLLTTGNSSTQLVTQGNVNLTPEQAHTYTMGIVVTPDIIPGFTASLDYFQTHLSNAISGLAYTNTTVQNLCIASAPAYDSPYCTLAVRPIAPGQPGYASTANYPTQVKSSPLNSGQTLTEGWDLETNYSFNLADVWASLPGAVTLRHIMTYQPVFETQLLPGTPFTFGGGSKTRMTTFLNYQIGNWGFSVQNVWISGRKKTADPTVFYAVPRLHSMDTTDFTVDRRVDLFGGSSDIYLNIQNVANTRAQLQGANASVPGLFYPGSGSDVGRYFTLGIRGNL